jgi:ABC-type sugar transport system permease subunit
MAIAQTGLRARATQSRVARVRRSAAELVFVAPILLVVGVAIGVPTVSVVTHAFTAWDPGYPSPWVGFDNFKALFESEQFQQILVNQAFLLLGIPLWIALPLAIAFLLHDGVAAPGVFRTILFFPATASPALIGILFVFVLAPTGPLNEGLRTVGLGALAQDWLADETLVKPVLIVVLAWATLGTGVVIFSAALSAVPAELFEAAEVDGASWWQRFRYVVLPSMTRVIELWTVILVISVFVAMFPWIFTMTRGGPGYSTTTIDFDIYQNALSFGYFGLAAAESVVLLVIVIAILGGGALAARALRRTG